MSINRDWIHSASERRERVGRPRAILAMCLLLALLLFAGTALAEQSSEYPVLVLDTETDVIIREGGEVSWFSFTPEESYVYRLEATGDYDNRVALYTDPAGEPLAENDDRDSVYYDSSESEQANFRLDYPLEAGTTYYYAARMCYADTVGDFTVKLTKQHPTVVDVRVVREPRLTYYAGIDTAANVNGNGALVEVTYADGTSVYRNLAYYTNDAANGYLEANHNAQSYYQNGYSYLKQGPFQITLSLYDWSQTFEAQVVSADQLPALTEDAPITTGMSRGQWFSFTAPRNDTYLFSAASASQEGGYLYVTDLDGTELVSLIRNSDTYNAVYTLNAGETYRVFLGTQKRNSGYGYSSNVDNTTTLSVGPASTLTEEFATGAGTPFFQFVPEADGAVTIELGFAQGASNAGYSPVLSDSEGNTISLISTSVSSDTFPEGYRYYTYSYDASGLKAGKTYYFYCRSTGSWAARVRRDTFIDLTDGQVYSGALATSQQMRFNYLPDEDGYYLMKLLGQHSLDYGFRGSYGSSWSATPNVPDDAEGMNYYRVCLLQLYQDDAFGVTLRNYYSDENGCNYNISIEKIPAVTELTVATPPTRTAYKRGDSVSRNDLAGMVLKAVYADGVEETIRINESGAMIGCRAVNGDAYDYSWKHGSTGRLSGGDQEITVTYLGASASYAITVESDPIPEDLPAFGEDGTLEGTLKYEGEDEDEEQVWFRATFTPEKSGVYNLTGSYSGDDDLYLYLYDANGAEVGLMNSYDNGWEYDLSWYLIGGEKYLLEGSTWVYEDSDYSLTMSLEDEVGTLELNEATSVTIGSEGRPAWFEFTPEETGRYRYYSSDNQSSGTSCDPWGAIYQGNEELASDDDGYGDRNFDMSVLLEQGVTYRFMARLYGSGRDGQYVVHVEKPPVVTAIEITSLPNKTVYAYPYEARSYNMDYYGLQITATLTDGTEENLSYGSRSDVTGSYMSVNLTDAEYGDNEVVKPGTYEAVVTYCDCTATFEITVEDVTADAEALAPDAEPLTGLWEKDGDLYWTLEVPADGYYSIVGQSTNNWTSLTVLDRESGNGANYINSWSRSGSAGEGAYWYGYEYLYRLQKDKVYDVRLYKPSSSDEELSYRISAATVAAMVPGREETAEISAGLSNFFQLSIDQAGFYRYDYQSTGNSTNDIPNVYPSVSSLGSGSAYSCGGDNYSTSATATGSSVTNYTREGTYFFYLEKGDYYLRESNSVSGTSGSYTRNLTRMSPAAWPLDYASETGISRYDGVVVAVPEGEEGTYTLQLESDYSGYAYLYQPGSTSSISNASFNSRYDENQGRYVYYGNLGATLESGKQYLLKMYNYNKGQAWSVKVDNKIHATELEIQTYPKQRYYYKLENLSATADLLSGLQANITYNDDTQETLYAYNTSRKTGQRMALTLPADVQTNASGYVMPGSYRAQLTYMDMEPVEVPITVATIDDMPKLALDENGQGSYTGDVEDANSGYGFVRFTANEDGFYNLTLSVDSEASIDFDTLYNSAYKSVNIDNTSSEYTDNRYIVNGSTYVRKGQTCYIRYYYYRYNSDGQAEPTFTLSVEKANDVQVTPLALNTPQAIEANGGVQWYSFTPETDGTYYLNTRSDEEYYSPNLEMHTSPDSAQTIGYWNYQNGNDRRVYYTMKAGKTYYYKVGNSSYNYRLILVKQANPVSLELLTEDDVYCTTTRVDSEVRRGFADLLFRITYDDDTTEEMTFGYRHTSTLNYSLMGTRMSVTAPSWVYGDDGLVATDREYTATFRYGNTSVVVPVIPRVIDDMDELQASQEIKDLGPNEAQYYKFTPENTGYYRFDASAGTTPSVSLYNNVMAQQSALFSNAPYMDGAYHQVKVYKLTGGELYCLRVGNNGTSPETITFVEEQLSPVASIEADQAHLPQTNYYLGIDRQFVDSGLLVKVTYEDGTEDTVEIDNGVGVSERTGLKMQTSLSSDTITHALGETTGSRTVYISYMGEYGTYTITVSDSDSLPALRGGEWSDVQTLPSAQDSAYLKFIPERSGFYRFTMRAEDEDMAAVVEAVKNASNSNLTMPVKSAAGDSAAVYLLEAKTYYLKGYLTRDGERAGGDYTALAERIDDLADGVGQGTVSERSYELYQYTTDEAGYSQFTLDGTTDTDLTVYGSTTNKVNLTRGQKNGSEAGRVRNYYAAKLAASTSYLAVVQNNGYDDVDFSIHAGPKPEITGIELVGLPERTVFYAAYDGLIDVSNDGIAIEISYDDGDSETLAYGERSSWGVNLTVDSSAIQADGNGGLLAGEYPVIVTYLDKTAEYTVEVKPLDIGSLEKLTEDVEIDFAGEAGESLFFAFDAAADSDYRLYTRNADRNLRGELYDSEGNRVTADVGGPDFSLDAGLVKDETYVIRIQAVEPDEDYTGTLKLHDANKSTEVTGVNIQYQGKTVDNVYVNSIDAPVALTALVAPAGADNPAVIWSSGDTDIATVDETGTVTLNKMGEVEITVTTEDGGYTATCRIICDNEKPEIVRWQPKEGDTIGPDYRKLSVLVHDNTGVHGIYASAWKQGEAEGDEEPYLNPDETNEQDVVLQAILKLADEDGSPLYNHGDVMEVKLIPEDKNGNRGDAVYTWFNVDLEAPEVKDLAGSHNAETLAVDLSWNVGTTPVEDTDHFEIYRKRQGESAWKRIAVVSGYANEADYEYSDDTVGNADETYNYYLVSYDVYGNHSASDTITVATEFIDQPPVVSVSAPGMAISGSEIRVNLNGTEDDIGIDEIYVEYGDGYTDYVDPDADDLSVSHAYRLSGSEDYEDLELVVTVTDTAGQTVTETRTVRVVNAEQAGVLYVTVVDTDGIPVPDAPVYFNLGEDNEEIINTDRTGKAMFIGAGCDAEAAESSTEGFHKVGVLKNGYLPEMKSVKLVNGSVDNRVEFVVTEKELVTGQFESRRLTYDEIVAIAESHPEIIDLNDPENFHTMQYDVTLEYETIHFNYSSGKVFNISGGSTTDGYTYIPYVPDENIVVVLKVPVAAQILKSFYDVKLFIMNNANEQFSLRDCQVELKIDPETGMTVMEGQNPALVKLEDIPGQTTREVEWILRGDKSGIYDVSADFSGVLSEFNKHITAHFISEDPLEVRGVDDLRIVMQIPDEFTDGEFYYNLQMINKAEEDNENTIIYMPQLRGEGELIQTSFTYADEGKPTIMDDLPKSMHAGDMAERFYRITDQVSAQLKKYPNYKDFVLHFRKAMVDEVTEVGVPLEIEVIPAAELAAKYQAYRAVPPEVTLTAPEVEYGYGEGEAVITAEVTPADNATYELSYTWYDTHDKKLGTDESLALPVGLLPGDSYYHVVVRATRTDNHNIADTEARVTVTVGKRTVELEWTEAEDMVYDGTEKGVAAAVGNGVGSDVVTVAVENGTAKDANTYVAKAIDLAGDDAEKYALAEAAAPEAEPEPEGADGRETTPAGMAAIPYEGDETPVAGLNEYVYTIQPREVGLTWTDPENAIYDGTAKTVTVAATNLVEGDTCEVAVADNEKVDAGTYTAQATGLDNTNYKLPEAVTHDFEIEPLEVVLEWRDDENLVYDGQPKNVNAVVSNIVTIDDVADDVTVTVTGGQEKDAGSYVATASALAGERAFNYKLPTETGKADWGYVIEPKTIGLEWTEDESMVYDGAVKTVRAAATELVEGDTCLVTVEGGENTDAGTDYQAVAVAVDNGNYKLPEDVLHAYAIEQRTAELAWQNDENLVYDGVAKAVSAVVTNLASVGETQDEVLVTVTGGDAVDANTEEVPGYTATAAALTGERAFNYKLPEETTKDYQIAPKDVTVTFAGFGTRTYDGAASNVTAAVTAGELVGEDVANVTVTGGDAVDADTHTATAASIDNTNYRLSGTLTQDYVIEPLTVELAWSGDQDLVYSGSPVAVVAAVSNAVEGDAVSVTVTGGDAVNAGSHTAAATALDNANYALPEAATREYGIAQLEAVLEWQDHEDLVYDGQPKNVSAIVGNAVTVDGAADEVIVTVNGGDAVNAGSYTATATALTGAAADNYKLPVEATLDYTIAPKPLELAWTEPASMTYDGTEKTVAVAAANLEAGDACELTVEGNAQTHAGSYTATVTGLVDQTNYALPGEVTHEYTIQPKAVALVWDVPETLVYDGTDHGIGVALKAGDVLEGDEVAIDAEGLSAKDAGEHTASVTALTGASAGDYALPEETTKTYEIAPKDVTVTFAGFETRTYDGVASNVTATVAEGELVSGDAAAVTVTGGDAKDAGSYTAEATAIDNANYALTGTLTQAYTIEKKTAELAWSNYENLICTGKAQNVTASVTNAVAGDAVNVTVENGDKIEIGSYTAKAVALDNANYALPAEGLTCEYTIEKDPKVDEAEKAIEELKDNVTLEDEATVAAAEAAYDALSEDQKALVNPKDVAKLTAAKGQIKKAKDDRAAAKAAADAIDELPVNAGVADKDKVAAARKAYEDLTADQKKLVDGDTLSKLTTAESQVSAAEKKAAEDKAAAEAAAKAINDLPKAAGVADKAKVETARKAYDNLTEDQKKLVSSDTLSKLTTAESQVSAAEKKAAEDKAAAEAAAKAINDLPKAAGVADKDKVAAARKAYDALTADQKKLVDAATLSKLTTAESQVSAAEAEAQKAAEDKAAADAAAKAINDLPKAAGVADKDKVAAARAAYDALTADQKKLVNGDTLNKLTEAEGQVKAAEEAAAAEQKAAEEKAAADQAAAQAVIDAINALPESAGTADKDNVAAVRAAYDALTEDQKTLVNADTLNRLTAAEGQVKAAEEAAAAEQKAAEEKAAADQAAAQAVIDAINALPANAGVADKNAVAAARAAYDALTDAQKALIGGDVAGRLTTAEGQVTAAEAAAVQPDPLPAEYEDTTGWYKINASELTATYWKPLKKVSKVKSAKIPDEIVVQGVTLKVTAIGEKAFYKAKKMTKVTIGKNVQTIGKSAFASCAKLKTVSGGSGIVTIGASAFKGDKVLTKITLGKKLTTIGKSAFNGCKKLKTVTIKSSKLKKVGSSAFKGVSSSVTFKCPSKKLKAYKKLIKKAGAPSKAKYKK